MGLSLSAVYRNVVVISHPCTASQNPGTQAAILAADPLLPLVRLLSSSSEKLQGHAQHIIIRLASTPTFPQQFVAAGACDHLVNMLHSKSASEQQRAVALFHILAANGLSVSFATRRRMHRRCAPFRPGPESRQPGGTAVRCRGAGAGPDYGDSAVISHPGPSCICSWPALNCIRCLAACGRVLSAAAAASPAEEELLVVRCDGRAAEEVLRVRRRSVLRRGLPEGRLESSQGAVRRA